MQKHTQAFFLKFVILLGFIFIHYSFSNPFHTTMGQKQIWRIEKIKYDYKKTQKNGQGSIAKSGIEMNAGTFIFNGDSTGSYSYIVDGIERKGTFKLSDNSSKKTFLYSSDGSQKELSVRNTYTVMNEEQDYMEISGEELTANKELNFVLYSAFYLTNGSK